MNSICKKFKKVISSVVLSCSMVCSCGFANASLWGRSISKVDLDKIKCLGNEWCEELRKEALGYRMWRKPSKTFLYVNDVWAEAVCNIVSDNDNIAAECIKKFIDNKSSLENLIDTGSNLAKEGKICNFSLSCWMVRYLEKLSIKCALASVQEDSSGSKLSSIACFSDLWKPEFGVIVFFEDKKENKNEPRLYIPYIQRTVGGVKGDEVSFANIQPDPDTYAHSYAFLGENDLAMLGLKGRKGRDFDLVTAKSWGSTVYIMNKYNNVTAYSLGGLLELIDDELFDQLIPTSEKELISKEQGFFSNFFSNNKKK